MSGGMDFWDRNKLKIIGSTKVEHVWSCYVMFVDGSLHLCEYAVGLCDHVWLES